MIKSDHIVIPVGEPEFTTFCWNHRKMGWFSPLSWIGDLGSYRIHGSELFHLSLCHARLPSSDACCPALLMDALMVRRALFERRELARLPVSYVHLIS